MPAIKGKKRGTVVKTAKIPKVVISEEAVLMKKDCMYQLGKSRLTEDTKLPPQAKMILTILDNGPLRREELIERIGERVDTTQSSSKILSYYQSKLERLNLMTFQNPQR